MTVFATINGTIETHAVITENCIPAQQVVRAYFYSVIPMQKTAVCGTTNSVDKNITITLIFKQMLTIINAILWADCRIDWIEQCFTSLANTVQVIWETVFTGQKTQPTVSKY